ncbi:RNA polymerase sigma-70 factor [Massilibacteroides sp.]|uniref:RNA polymerase sigma-70 factor n=1 Tax=Massilibacteroides sp. TaxID=2034766 RepID=UPI00261726E7|nr:RNA polymerase sigma-70 factor [Massilibacteroides sp.]MDD4514202.1 RNA polymerase sigma-70 factor [Massilibacteroides sp.]
MKEQKNISKIDQIYSEYKERYIRFALSYVRDKDTAEDMVMEAILYYWENRASLTDVKNIPLYILTVIKNKCLNYLQRLRSWNDLSDKILTDQEWDLKMRISSLSSCDPAMLFCDEVQVLLRKAIGELPEKTRAIFLLSREDEKSYKEIAEITGLSVKSVEFHISKALTHLRQRLKDYLPLLLPVFDFFYN